MTIWLAAVAAALAATAAQYLWLEPGPRQWRLAAALCRALALTLIVALLLDAPVGRQTAVRPFVGLDASLSWLRGEDSTRWRLAVDSARMASADSVFAFGDSVRHAGASPNAADNRSAVRPMVERALAAGRPLVVVTDGALDDPEALEALPRGSRTVVMPADAHPDAALLSLAAPRAAVAGDTLAAVATIVAGSAGSAAGALELFVGQRAIGRAAWEALRPAAEIAVTVSGSVPGAVGATTIRAVLTSPGDGEPRNDTLAIPLDISRAAAAVLVSTTPDYDARYALVVLRGALRLPTRAFFRVAPGAWRADGTLAAVPEEAVRAALRDAPLAIIHGDSLIFGPPRAAARGSLALLAPPRESSSEWYAMAAPPSPLAPALSSVLWDSLPPLDVASAVPRGDWVGLETARARRLDRRPAIVGSEHPRRTVVVAASGLWRWQFRGGASAEAYAALWGSVFDWLAAGRRDVRAAIPAEDVLRAGDAPEWRRGGDDSVVTVVLRRRGEPARTDTMTLRFPEGATLARSAALPAGTYDAEVPGGSAVIVVNASRELLPRPTEIRSGAVGGAALAGISKRLRSLQWVFALAILLLCAEWLVRRRAGLR